VKWWKQKYSLKQIRRALMPKKKINKKVKLVKKKSKITKKVKHTRKTKKRVISGDKIYKIINQVQSKRKPCEFAVSLNNVEVIKHILEDLSMKFTCKDAKNGVDFKLWPDPNANKDILDEGTIEENIFGDILGEE
jgi:hypothetical protein